MAGLSSLLRLDPMFSIYQKIASEAPKTAPAPRYDWLIEIDDFSIPSRSRPAIAGPLAIAGLLVIAGSLPIAGQLAIAGPLASRSFFFYFSGFWANLFRVFAVFPGACTDLGQLAGKS